MVYSPVRRLAFRFCLAWGSIVFLVAAARAEEAVTRLAVLPAEVQLSGNFAQAQLLVAAVQSDGTPSKQSDDLTYKASYQTSDAKVVTVNESGRLLAEGDGTAKIVVTVGDVKREVPVTVSGVQAQPQLQYLE